MTDLYFIPQPQRCTPLAAAAAVGPESPVVLCAPAQDGRLVRAARRLDVPVQGPKLLQKDLRHAGAPGLAAAVAAVSGGEAPPAPLAGEVWFTPAPTLYEECRTAACRAAANGSPVPSHALSRAVTATLSIAAASSAIAAVLPDSEPKQSCSTQPSACRVPTAPLAKRCAVAVAKGSGSSSTRSTPPQRAACARANLSQTAAPPR